MNRRSLFALPLLGVPATPAKVSRNVTLTLRVISQRDGSSWWHASYYNEDWSMSVIRMLTLQEAFILERQIDKATLTVEEDVV